MKTHSVLSKAVSALTSLALIVSLFGFAFAASVQQARAATLAEQIICFVDQELGPDVPFNPQTDYCGSGEPTDPGDLPQCFDTTDNDGDGLVDLNDPGCSGPTDDSESPDPALMQCQDTQDNDNDGVTDLADPDCDSATDNTESGTMGTSTGTTTPMQCQDTLDNDSDGVVDLNDPDCSNAEDNTESGSMGTSTGTTTPMQCADATDNDGDGLVDLNDPGCSSAEDNDETNSSGGNGSTTPTLTIVKNALGGNGTFEFSINGAGTTSLTTTNGWATSSEMTLSAGSSTIAEAMMSGWTTTGISCREGGQSIGTSTGTGAHMITAANGDEIICTFTNTATSTGTTTDAALHVDSIDAQKTTAIANNSYLDGWRYLFHITAPNNEENLAMRFSDWVSGSSSSTIPVANNMRVSSAQAASTSPITLTGSNVYSTPPMVMTTDLNPSMPGRQVEVLVEVKIPTSTPNETFTTVYGVQTLP